MKRYRLKEEVKKYLSWGGELTAEQWKEKGVELEALEEVKEVLTYKDVAMELFQHKVIYFTDIKGRIDITTCDGSFYHPNNALTSYQLECLMASNMLTSVANYLNDGCEFNEGEDAYYIVEYKGILNVHCCSICKDGATYFKTEKLAMQAIEILGEETIIKALTKNF